jgi:hypothetical protein
MEEVGMESASTECISDKTKIYIFSKGDVERRLTRVDGATWDWARMPVSEPHREKINQCGWALMDRQDPIE